MSHVFERHPDWFVKGQRGQRPLRSDLVTFGRLAPWAVGMFSTARIRRIQGSTLESLCRTMRREWERLHRYFKFDAILLGLPSMAGTSNDPRASRIDAYSPWEMQAYSARELGTVFSLGGGLL
jgi:hypothetical protein